MANVQVNQPPDPLNLLGQLLPGFKLNFPSFNPQTIINQATGPIKAVWGETAPNAPGWITIDYNLAFTVNPAVVALQSPNTNTPAHINPPVVNGILQWENLIWQYINNGVIPQVNIPAIPLPPLPPVPESWGTVLTSAMNSSSWYGIINTLTFGLAGDIVGLVADGLNALQTAYWAITGDWGSIINSATDQAIIVANNAANAAIAQVEGFINSAVIDPINSQISGITNNINNQMIPLTSQINTAVVALQNGIESAVNSVFTVINDWVGLLPGLSLPVTQVRNITTTSCEIYCPGNYVPVYWLVLGS